MPTFPPPTHPVTTSHRAPEPAPEPPAPARPRTVPRALESALRREGLRVKSERTRGHVALKVWAGIPGSETPVEPSPGPAETTWLPSLQAPGPVSLFVPGPGEQLDVHDRFEVALALASAVLPFTPQPWMWLTRSGTPDPCPEDLEWLASAQRAWYVLGIRLDAAVVTREGWWLHPSGVRRTWQRLRA